VPKPVPIEPARRRWDICRVILMGCFELLKERDELPFYYVVVPGTQ
jgi:hypothetical protein